MKSIKLKLVMLYIALVIIVMIVSGTFMLTQVRSGEIVKANILLDEYSELIRAQIVVGNSSPYQFQEAFVDAKFTLSARGMQGCIIDAQNLKTVAPREFLHMDFGDSAIIAALNGQVGFSPPNKAADINDTVKEWISCAKPVYGTEEEDQASVRYVIYTRLDAASMNESLADLTFTILVMVLLAMFMTGVMGYIFANTLTGPIITLTKRAKSMAKGNFDQKIPVSGTDEIGQLTETINEMASELSTDAIRRERLDSMRKEFVANVSHELRTPLTTVKTYSETLLDGALESRETAEDFLRVIHSEADRMSLLVKDLLELSRLDNQQLSLDMELADLNEVIDQCIRQNRILAEQKEISVRFDRPRRETMTEADSGRINQVVTNIITNSIKYSPRGSEIHICVNETRGYYDVVIRDNGMGIPPEDLGRVFERFYRVDKARSREMGGTGLGLSIAKEIMEAHGGKITAASEVGKGTSMTLRFIRHG